MSIKQQHHFWGENSPLGGLTGIGLLIMASARLSWAITVSVGLFWIYGLTALTFAFLASPACKKIFPQTGRIYVFVCLASFFGSIYILIFWLLSPFAVVEVLLPLLLVPLFCTISEIPQRIILLSDKTNIDIVDCVTDAISQAAVLAGLLIAFSLIREPLAYSSLSFPGTNQGMIVIVHFWESAIFPAGIFTASAGALLLLGYFICLYQYFREKFFQGNV